MVTNSLRAPAAAIGPSKATTGIHAGVNNAILVSPVLMMSLGAAFLFHPATRGAMLWLLKENHPVELLTFAAAMTGGILGLRLARRSRKQGEKALVFGFYALFSAALIIVGLEEAAWGQQFFGFDVPAAWRSINVQDEATLHNITGVQGRTEIFRLIFGLGGLVGVWLSSRPHIQRIGAPMILAPWFAVITLHAGVDVYNDFFPITKLFDFYMQRTSELNEMLIAVSGFLYIVLKPSSLALARKKGTRYEH